MAVGFAPSSVATASGSALQTKKLLLSDVLLDSSPTLSFVPEVDAVFCSGNFSASLPEAETWGGADERRGESMTMFTSSSSFSTAVLNSRSRFGGTALKGGASLGTAKGGTSVAAQ